MQRSEKEQKVIYHIWKFTKQKDESGIKTIIQTKLEIWSYTFFQTCEKKKKGTHKDWYAVIEIALTNMSRWPSTLLDWDLIHQTLL